MDRFGGLGCRRWQRVWHLARSCLLVLVRVSVEFGPVLSPDGCFWSELYKVFDCFSSVSTQNLKSCRPETSFLAILFSFEYLWLRCSKSSFSFFPLWSFVILVNNVGATVLGFLCNSVLIHEEHYSSLYCTKTSQF